MPLGGHFDIKLFLKKFSTLAKVLSKSHRAFLGYLKKIPQGERGVNQCKVRRNLYAKISHLCKMQNHLAVLFHEKTDTVFNAIYQTYNQ